MYEVRAIIWINNVDEAYELKVFKDLLYTYMFVCVYFLLLLSVCVWDNVI